MRLSIYIVLWNLELILNNGNTMDKMKRIFCSLQQCSLVGFSINHPYVSPCSEKISFAIFEEHKKELTYVCEMGQNVELCVEMTSTDDVDMTLTEGVKLLHQLNLDLFQRVYAAIKIQRIVRSFITCQSAEEEELYT
jgi:hypothetical protein